MRVVAVSSVVGAALVLTGASAWSRSPQNLAGKTQAEVVQEMGRPTGTYTMPDGTTRLEYASGPFGRTTWMVDIDAQGRATRSEQVLTPERFRELREGMPADDVRRLIGRPGEVRRGGRAGGEVWNWRYPTTDCLWFEVAIIDGRARAPAIVTDPRCDPPS